jgi:hypothetical protein
MTKTSVIKFHYPLQNGVLELTAKTLVIMFCILQSVWKITSQRRCKAQDLSNDILYLPA